MEDAPDVADAASDTDASSAAPAPWPVPSDVRPVLARHPGFDWGGVAWDAVRARAAQVDRAEALGRRSRLRAAEARALGRELRGPS
jgi:hypothetical protein